MAKNGKTKPYHIFDSPTAKVPVKAWVEGVPLELDAKTQLLQVAELPFIYRWIAAMPDVHVGIGATVGSVIPTEKAIIPAAVGVDLGCGMMAVETTLDARYLPDSLFELRSRIEQAVPHGRTVGKQRDKGSWNKLPAPVVAAWKHLQKEYERLCEKFPRLSKGSDVNHLGTLGTGSHFVEACIDEGD